MDLELVELLMGLLEREEDGRGLRLLEELAEEACPGRGQAMAGAFREDLPRIRRVLDRDAAAALDRDPAAESPAVVRLAYPGFRAVRAYRMAHRLWELGLPLVPRLMTEWAHSRTGIDIHPGARIGGGFFIDHGTGVVIGETTVIGEDVTLYQGVTLGGLSTRGGQSLRGMKRHPTLEDRVTVYANATVLGGETVIGHDSVIGANAFVTQSVPAHSRVRPLSPG